MKIRRRTSSCDVVDLRGEVGLIELLEGFQLAPDQLPLALERDPPA